MEQEFVKLDCDFNPRFIDKDELFDIDYVLSNPNYEILFHEGKNITCRDKVTNEIIEYNYTQDIYSAGFSMSIKKHIKNNSLYLYYRIPKYCRSIYEKTYIISDNSSNIIYKISSCVDVFTNIIEEIKIEKIGSLSTRYKFDFNGNSRDCYTFKLIDDLSLNDRINLINSIYFK